MKSDKTLKYIAYFCVAMLVSALIPLMVLGFYAHPVGDDYYYGCEAAKAFCETGNIFSTFVIAAKGVVSEYFRWQGTYSAMFFMYLPPYVFGDFFYKLYPSVLLCVLILGLFYMLKPLIVSFLNGSVSCWLAVSSLLGITFLEQVPLCGETFYWYNGSMYYTGFLAATFILFGGILRFLKDKKFSRLFFLIPCSLFIAGGNYSSLLPAVLFIVALNLRFALKKDKKAVIALSSVLLSLLTGFAVSVLAPGNALRQATSYKLPAVKAVLKSILQFGRYELYWNGIFSFAVFMLLVPLFIHLIKGCSFSFKYPVLHCLIVFLIFCSSETPPFYAQNNGGAARLFDICFYMMILCTAFCEFYLLGFAYRKYEMHEKNNDTRFFIVSEACIVFIFIVLLFVRPLNESNVMPNSIRASKCLLSGEASFYDSQYKERMSEVYANPDTDLIFESYMVPDDLVSFLHVGDMGNADNPVNIAFSKCYGLNSVTVR